MEVRDFSVTSEESLCVSPEFLHFRVNECSFDQFKDKNKVLIYFLQVEQESSLLERMKHYREVTVNEYY